MSTSGRIGLVDNTFVCPVHNQQFDLRGFKQNVKPKNVFGRVDSKE